MDKKEIFFLAIILLACVFLHLLAIGKIPPGITNDEAGVGYDAYSILKTGKDQWGNFLPLEFKGFGDYRLPVFTYSAVPFIYFFDLSPFSIRLTSLMYSLFLAGAVYLLAKKLFNSTIGLFSCLLVVLLPWSFSMTRIAIESPPALFFTVLGVYLLLKANSNGKYFLFSFLCFVVSFYTYYSVRLFVPLLLIAYFAIYKKQILKQKKWLIVSFILVFILCLPIGKALVSGGGGARLLQTNISHDVGVLNNLNEKRGACLENLPFPICRLVYNKPAAFGQKLANNYLNHFSLNFLFFDSQAKGVLGSSALCYFSLLPLFFIGLVFLLFKRSKEGWLLIAWLAISPLADSLTSEGHFSRSFLMIVPLCIISAVGGYWLYQKSLHSIKISILAGILFLLLLFETGTFCVDYFFHYPKFYSIYTHYEYQPLFDYLCQNKKDYPQIYISRRYRDTKQYVFYLFYCKYDPAKFQQGENVDWEIEKDGWIWVKKIGKWNFAASMPELESIPSGSLLIGVAKEEIAQLPKQGDIRVKPIKTIKYLNGDPAFSIVQLIKEQPNDF